MTKGAHLPANYDPSSLTRSVADFSNPLGPQLLERTQGFYDWVQVRLRADNWPFTRCLETAPGTTARVHNEVGRIADGTNFGSQDYLSLAAHPAVAEAAARALRDYGPHSAGSPNLLGNTRLSEELEKAIGELLRMPCVLLFPTGWGAGFGSIVGLIRPADHIVMDRLSHACLHSGAFAATGNVRRHDHLDVAAARSLMAEIRAKDTKNSILVVTEGLFSMDSDIPRIGELQQACREYQATLLVDVAHDLGALGPGGSGALGIQGMLGKVDLVMGSFSKTFASNGGFLACHTPAVKQFVKWFGGPHVFSNAISPMQTAAVLETMRIVRSEEGDRLRSDLMRNVMALRDGLLQHDIRCLGEPSAIVPVPIGAENASRLAFAALWDRGVIANLVEYPAVAIGAARFRMQVQAKHTPAQASAAAHLVAELIREARAAVRDL